MRRGRIRTWTTAQSRTSGYSPRPGPPGRRPAARAARGTAPHHRRRRAVAGLLAGSIVPCIVLMALAAVGRSPRRPTAAPEPPDSSRDLRDPRRSAGRARSARAEQRRARTPRSTDARLHAVRSHRRRAAPGARADVRRRPRAVHAAVLCGPQAVTTCRRRSSRSACSSSYFHASTTRDRRARGRDRRSHRVHAPMSELSRGRPAVAAARADAARSASTARRSRGCSVRRTDCGTRPRCSCCASTGC